MDAGRIKIEHIGHHTYAMDPRLMDRAFTAGDALWNVRGVRESAAWHQRNARRTAWIRATAPDVLTPKQRAYVYCILDGWRLGQVAGGAGVGVWSVKVTVRRAVVRLRTVLHSQRTQGLETPQ